MSIIVFLQNIRWRGERKDF